jgi:outer membrane immunogenic protein
MKRLTLATLGLATLMATPAISADLPPRRPVYAPPPPVYVFSWTGCYIGGNVGGVWVEKDFDSRDFGVFGGRSFSRDASGAIGGGQIGCNYQFAGGFVIGIQGDYDWTNVHAEGRGAFFNNLDHDYHVKSVASVTGRVGYGWNRFLGYVKGGGAWERDDLTFTFVPTGRTASFSDTRSGWTIGVGGEYAFTNWLTGFVEYNYYDFGTRTDGVVCGAVACFAGGPNRVDFDIRETKSVVKVGLNFLFGTGGGPIFARY